MASTTYEKFKAGRRKDAFDVVLLVFIGDVSYSDLQKKQDYYDYYTQAPIVHYAIGRRR